jgi:uncharacterized membrane protein YjjB (DUF3815 family)
MSSVAFEGYTGHMTFLNCGTCAVHDQIASFLGSFSVNATSATANDQKCLFK